MKQIILFLLLFPFLLVSQSFPDKPNNYVNDEADVLSQSEESQLNKRLRVFEDSTSTQVFVYIAPSLNGYDLSDLSQQIFAKWDIGQQGKNNGILIAVFVNDHKFRIHTGYGLEGVLPDLLTKKIQDEEMRPSFKNNNYYEGISKGIDKIIYYSKNEYRPDEYDPFWGLVIMYVAAVFVYFIYFLLVRYALKEYKTARIVLLSIGGVFLLIPFFGLILLGIMVIIFIIVSIVKLASKASRGFSSVGSTTSYYSSYSNDSSYSSSDSSYSSSSSSDSDSSFSGGGGGDSGGGGSDSDW